MKTGRPPVRRWMSSESSGEIGPSGIAAPNTRPRPPVSAPVALVFRTRHAP